MVEIELVFAEGNRGLAWFDKGVKTYEEQVKPNYTGINDKITLKFPEHIEQVTSSFVQGLFDEWIHSNGYQWIQENVIIETSGDYLREAIWDRIY